MVEITHGGQVQTLPLLTLMFMVQRWQETEAEFLVGYVCKIQSEPESNIHRILNKQTISCKMLAPIRHRSSL